MFLPMANVANLPHPEALRTLILDICRHREWATPADLATWFDMHRCGLGNHHVRPFLEAAPLERSLSESPNTPKQACRARRQYSHRASQ